MRARRFWAAVGSLALVAGVAAPSTASPSTTPLAIPNSMAALGDSITIAYDIKSLLKADPTYSWSTGTQTAVNSVYSRLKTKNPSLSAVNLAVSGAKIGDLVTQASSTKLAAGTDLVTILMGANDACTKTETGSTGMTSVETFGIRADAAMAALAKKGVDQIVVASIPDIKKLWEAGRLSSSARFIWGLYGICQSMLKNPTSFAAADVERRERVRTRVIDFNAELARACKAVTVPCKFDDDNAVFNTEFALADISRVDYFHPSVSGQNLLAATTYTAFGFPAP
jgi:GDSL-like Lipase/Acylhydrolase family